MKNMDPIYLQNKDYVSACSNSFLIFSILGIVFVGSWSAYTLHKLRRKLTWKNYIVIFIFLAFLTIRFIFFLYCYFNGFCEENEILVENNKMQNLESILKLGLFHILAELCYSILILGYYIFVLQMKKFWRIKYHEKISMVYQERHSFMPEESNEIDYSY